MGRKPRGLTESDRAAWAAYAARIAPLPGRDPTTQSAPPPPVHADQTAQPTTQSRPNEPAYSAAPSQAAILPPRPVLPQQQSPAALAVRRPLAVGDAPGGLDGASWQRLRSGKFSAERKLDLHGLTAQRAYHALVAFLRSAHSDRLRCVEVITGRGSGDETGVLRRELPMWLNRPDIRPLVLAAAHPHAANPGAVRLLLRRVR
jgi:DNA-nicking Smr family endonuclease